MSVRKTINSVLKKGISNFNFIARSKVNGKSFKIPILGNVGISNLSISEQWMVELLKALLKIDANKFVDVGVNVGQTLLKLRSVDSTIEYLGFEPNPTCIFYVNKLIRVNAIQNTSVYPVGISSKSGLGELNFYFESETDGSASIIENFNNQKVNRKEYIPLFAIEHLKDKVNFNGMSILKIDVEGAELEVIKSFRDEIVKNNPFILMEVLPIYDEAENPERLDRQNKLQELLTELEYTMFRIIKEKKELLGLQKLQSIEVHSDINNCEYLFAPTTKCENLNSTQLVLKK
ncbi:MAG: FkbM family methyltransferase [Aequorivita sp.]